ncbi:MULTISPECIES: AHH domain-containing protein [unclassified Corallococcus]|uniref:AHH domain-containing protein n=1 Tax=unclassified Corallococcus TaxID=2685029 RepID=UPI001F326322|nr:MULTISPECIES: AHH domain-containing protein [unclassified Corallococcus]
MSLLLLTAGCATTRVVHVDTGNGQRVVHESVDVEPVQVSEDAFKSALTQLILDMRMEVAFREAEAADERGWVRSRALLASMTLEDVANKVRLKGHEGPHPERYHAEVVRRLETAVKLCRTPETCRAKLMNELAKIADELLTRGSDLRSYLVK